jgi:acyl-CoA hydrolase/GNAT superfamily N-acetyltransferase
MNPDPLPRDRVVSREEALDRIRNGDRVFISSACATPLHLVEGLQEGYRRWWDVEIIHLLPSGEALLTDARYHDHFRYNTFGVGSAIAPAVQECAADYTPMHFSELPRLLRTGRYPIDVALISVTPPDRNGLVSLGPSVGIARDATRAAKLVIAQVDERLPRTRGETLLPVYDIDLFVVNSDCAVAWEPPEEHPAGAEIARFAAELVEDGDIVHAAHDALSWATLRALKGRRRLGIHTSVFTEPMMELIEAGAVDGSTNPAFPGRAVATAAVGTSKLLEFIDGNERVALVPLDQVTNRSAMARYRRMVAFRAGARADVTGNVLLDTVGSEGFQDIGTGMDFLRGAAQSDWGYPVLLIPSCDPETGESNLVSRLEHVAGKLVDRASVQYIVTEYGFVHLHAKTLRERVLGMVAVAHPRHRERLMAEAKELGYVPADQLVTPFPGCLYPNEMVTHGTFKDGLEVFFRPIHPSDERGLQRMFYGFSSKTVRMRYHAAIKNMTHAKVQLLTNIDYRKDIAIVGMTGRRGDRTICCVGRSMYYGDGYGEVDITIADAFQGVGLGTFLLTHVTEIARSRGMKRLTAEILDHNRGARRLFGKIWRFCAIHRDGGVVTYTYELQPEEFELEPF